MKDDPSAPIELDSSQVTGAPAMAPDPSLEHGEPLARVVRPDLNLRRWQVQSVGLPEQEGWLLTYLDVITLLLVMMVVMLSFSEPVGGARSGISIGQEIGSPWKIHADSGRAAGAPARGQSEVGARPPTSGSSADAPSSDSAASRQATTQERLDALGLVDLGKDIQVSVEQGIVRFRISSEIMFDSAQAGLVGQGRSVLESLIPVLRRAAGQRIVIEGHTDSLPIQTDRFPSNWELSSARASSVARYLIEGGIDPARIRVSGLADTMPIADNRDATRRAANRRVELILETVQGPQK